VGFSLNGFPYFITGSSTSTLIPARLSVQLTYGLTLAKSPSDSLHQGLQRARASTAALIANRVERPVPAVYLPLWTTTFSRRTRHSSLRLFAQDVGKADGLSNDAKQEKAFEHRPGCGSMLLIASKR